MEYVAAQHANCIVKIWRNITHPALPSEIKTLAGCGTMPCYESWAPPTISPASRVPSAA
jgi:hypothetical protein